MSTTPPLIGQAWPEQGGIYIGQRILPDGSHWHYIMASADTGEAAWGEYGKNIKGADCASDGQANTVQLLKADSPAAQLATNHTSEGHSDFFLPSQQDMQLISANRFINEGLYWTSTQCSANLAWYQSFYYGFTDFNLKNLSVRVRPVRRFKL